MTAALNQLPTLINRLRHRHPTHSVELDRIDDTVTELAHWYPRARAILNRGDGLRSPSLQPHRGGGGHADPVATLIEADWADTGRTRRGHTGRLDQADGRIRAAHLALTYAPPGDPGGAIRNAQQELDRALSLTHGAMPKSYDRTKLRLDNPPCCSNCLEHGHHAEAAPGMRGLCRWCYDTSRAIGRLPEAELVTAHRNGRITRTVLDQLDRAAERRRATKRAKRKAGKR